MNATLLEQAVSNLVDNAIKHSEAGTCVRITGRANTEGTLIVVQDEGCGHCTQASARLFERFYRVDKARSRESGGPAWVGDCEAHCWRTPRHGARREHGGEGKHVLYLSSAHRTVLGAAKRY